MLCYLAGMEPYYLKCIKDGLFQPKTAKGDPKPESQWTPDERRVVVQDQRLKSIIISCLPNDVMESVISCVSAKETWTNLVHSFEGPLDTKENRIMDLKLEYQTFRAKSTESLSQTYTRYKTLRNELANDGVNLSKHEINVDIYGRFFYEDNLIQRRYSDTKKALITTPSRTPISTAFFSNNVIQDFQENSDDEVDESTSEEYLRDLDIEYHERSLLENSKRFIKRRNNFSVEKANENTECYKCGNKADPKFQKDYKAEYKKMKAKLALLEVKVLMALADDELTVGKSHARNGEWVDITMRKVNTLLSMDEDADWKNYLKDELLILKQAKLDVVTFQIQNAELIKLNHALQEKLKEEKKINEKWLTSSKKVSQCISEQIPHQKKKVLGGELLTESSSKKNENGNLLAPAYMGYDQEMVPKTKDWVERLNPDSKLPNFNTGRILVPESQAVNESLKTSNTSESSKDSEAEFLTPLPPLKILQGASPSSEMLIDKKANSDQKTQESNSKIQKAESSKSVDSSKISQDSKPKVQSTGSSKSLKPKPIQKPQLKCELCHYTNHSTDDCYRILYCMICKREDHRTSDHEMYIALLKKSENYKAQPYQYASFSKQILRAKVKPLPPCTHCGFNNHIPGDCRNYPKCEIYGSYDHSTSGYNCVIQIRGGVLA
ncbi:hypothetical protein Tco_0185142 [Tanacetum coccineum]